MDWLDLHEGVADLFIDAQTIVVERVRTHSRNAAPAKQASSRAASEPRDRRARDAAYCATHRDQILASKRAWWHANKARVSEQRREKRKTMTPEQRAAEKARFDALPKGKRDKKAYLAAYYRAHAEEIKARSAKWHRENRERADAARRVWHEKNTERHRELQAAWARKNRAAKRAA